MQSGDVDAVGRWLQSAIGVPFVVVGGSAIERVASVTTKDVDVLIEASDRAAVDSALESRRDASPLDPATGSIRATVLSIGGANIDLEFISGGPFSGRYGPGSFGRYVREHGSVVYDGVRYASPGVVFYMRINSPDDWRLYVSAIERDLRAGVPERTLDEAARIADRFGVGPRVRERIKSLRAKLRGFDPRRE
ncbi:MAG: hypothetical protein WB947_08025 [Thermoplasmata archaeon]